MSTTKNPTVLILGATGSIGHSLVRELVTQPGSENLQIRAADNFRAITGRKPTLWQDFAVKHRDEFLYLKSGLVEA